MTDYLEQLRALAATKKTGWQNADCPVVRTTRMETEPAWKKALRVTKLTEEDLYKKCAQSIQAQAIFRKAQREAGEKPAQPKMLSAWLNAGRWEEEIGSHADIKEKAKLKKCRHCNNDVMGQRFTVCHFHLDHDENGKYIGRMAEELRQWWKDNPDKRASGPQMLKAMLGGKG